MDINSNNVARMLKVTELTAEEFKDETFFKTFETLNSLKVLYAVPFNNKILINIVYKDENLTGKLELFVEKLKKHHNNQVCLNVFNALNNFNCKNLLIAA